MPKKNTQSIATTSLRQLSLLPSRLRPNQSVLGPGKKITRRIGGALPRYLHLSE